MKIIGFVILTWNSKKTIIDCLKSIYSFSRYDFIISLVDNCSTDGTCDLIDNFCRDKIIVTKLDKNYGTTVSRNIGIRKIIDKCDFLCILDSDTVVNENSFDFMVSLLEDFSIGIVGPKLVGLNNKNQYNGRYIPSFLNKINKIFPWNKDKIDYVVSNKPYYDVGYLMSACWLMRKDFILINGYLDEKIFYSPEDVEFCARCLKNNYRVVYCNCCQIFHFWQRISRKKFFSKHNFEHLKGLFYFSLKYHCFFSSSKMNRQIKI